MATATHIITRDPLPFFCCMATAVMVTEFSAIGALSLPHGMAIAVLEHLLVVWLLLVWVYYSYGKRDSRLALLLLVTTAATGPFGPGICLGIAITYTLGRKGANTVPCQWINDFFFYEEDLESDRVHERVSFGLDDVSGSHIEPFQDILEGGTVLQKQMAIAKITQHFHPRFAPHLLHALQDPNAAVRVQAATGLAKIEHDFMAEYLQNKQSSEHSGGEDPTCLRNAALCDNYAHAGIAGQEDCREYRRRAITLYEDYLKGTDDPECKQRLARLYLRQDQPEKAYQLLNDAVESGDTSARDVLWYMEALFRLKKIRKLRQVAKNYAHLLSNFDGYKAPGEARDVLAVWGVSYAA